MWKKIVGFGLVTLSLSLAATASHAQIQCGETILPGQKVKLTGNVGPCTPETGGIVVRGPATLDLNGFTVFCQLGFDSHLNPTGIELVDERAKVKNGSVIACSIGVALRGNGRHKVQNVLASGASQAGFYIRTERNVLKGNTAMLSDAFGFEVRGSRTTLKKNLAVDNGIDGFFIREEGHRVIRNEALDNGLAGMRVIGHGSRPSKFVRNVMSNPEALWDLSADPQACVENIWKANVLETSFQGCLQ